jgi:hypothetical protein
VLPPANQPLTAPTLPEAGVPTLPGIPSAPAPTPGTLSDPIAPVGPVALHESATTTNPGPKQGGSSIGKFLPILLVLGAGALGYVGFTSMSSGDADEGVGSPVATAAPVATAPAAGSPLLVPINDAKDVVEQINENSTEQDALDELGLGGRGEPVVTEAPRVEAVDLSVGAGVQVHAGDVIKDDLVTVLGAPTFNYRFQRGAALEQSIWVDSASGNRELFDGTTYVRAVDGVVFQTTDPTGAWAIDPAVMPTDSLALRSAMVTLAEVLPEDLLNEVTATTAGEASASGRYLFVDAELAEAAPGIRGTWLTSWGFDPTMAPLGIDGFVDGVPDVAAPGMILVTVVTSSDGIVTSLTIEAPGLGERVDYRLVGASMEPLAISRPAAVIE